MPRKLPFRVLHVSGQDDSYRAAELNYHSPLTKGWQSSRYCLYPQDIIVQLDARSRLKKIQILSHQCLVATKIEFYVGDVPDDMSQDLENARYTRLGYVSLSDNEKTGYKARELKSVHVDATGLFLKLNIHKNHINKFNLYNQVGIIAINVIGDEIRKPIDYTEPDIFLDPQKKLALENDPALEGLYTKPDYISPLDDLAFDMYQDPEIAGIIRKLEKKKQEAVLQERFDYAKKLKNAISELQKVGEKLGKFEVEKRQAIENEDYDKAKLKKVQMDEYRLQVYKDLNLADLLEMSGSRHPQHVDLEPIRQPTPPRLQELQYHPRTPPSSPPPRTPYDERPLPAMKNFCNTLHEKMYPIITGITGEPEPMTEKELREASYAIDVFGEPLVSKAYSKTWSYREDALLAVYKQMQELPATAPKEESKTMMRASVFLVKRAIDDKVYAVFKAGLHLLKMILTEYIPKHKIQRQDTVYTVEKTMPNLLHKGGDTALRCREDIKTFIEEEAFFAEVKPTNIVPHDVIKPFKQTLAPRQAQSHCEIVEKLYQKLGIKSNSGLTVDNIMQFCVNALGHHSGEVRDVSERIIKELYKEVGQPVKDYLPPDNDKTRKITLYRQLFEFFDKVDGKPSKADLKKQRNDEEAKKQAEIDALQQQLQQLKDMASGKQVVEIASYTEHLLTECEAKGNYAKCPRCSEAIPKSEFDEHVAIKSCNPSKQGTNHCPLCHQNIGSGEDGWKNHLMGRDGCKQNPRRLLALNKQPPTSKSNTLYKISSHSLTL
ncbi:hypothetical protein FSP39_012411 [Pinctada imbricata]|uniref:Centrosomal protein of 104 kDa n=1 Tax=Pinctada imbricata TaxID=66713 RepID=A0AA88YHB4_PINIB|nr:hypothetical protein FSP39_012411 [Pinctada imbricata]